MFIDDYTIHEIVCDYLNQNERLSQTEVIRFNQNTNGCEAIVLSAELGKVKKRYKVKISIDEY